MKNQKVIAVGIIIILTAAAFTAAVLVRNDRRAAVSTDSVTPSVQSTSAVPEPPASDAGGAPAPLPTAGGWDQFPDGLIPDGGVPEPAIEGWGPDVPPPTATGQDQVDSLAAAQYAAGVWVDKESDPASRAAALRSACTPFAWQQLGAVDPASITAARITDAGTEQDVTGTSADYTFTTDTGELSMTLIKQDGAWLVTDVRGAGR